MFNKFGLLCFFKKNLEAYLMTIGYQLKSTANQIWIIFCMLLIALTAVSTMYWLKPKPNIKALDLEIAKETLKNGSTYCMSIKAKSYIARASGMEVSAGCLR